ncbi:MAG: Rib/alpha-like domain-containing protein [Erysipelotrichaceae bacterium]
MTANPTATGTKTFTYNEMIERFGGEMVYFSLSGSTGVVARTQTISAIQTYPYEVNYYVQLADGTKTLNKVPGISPNPKTGKLPAGINNIGPLPNVAKYVVVPGQNTNVNITSSATADVFNYYYIDDAPVINGADDKEIFIGESFDPLAGVTANDDEDGSITLTAGNVIGSVNTQQADSYTLTYTVIDSAGNKTIVYRNITVKNRKLILHSGSSNTTHTQIVNNPTAINLDSIDTSSTGAFYLDGSDFWGWTITEGNTTPDYLNESSNISTDKYLYNGTLNVPVEKLGTPDANGDYHLYAVYAPKITVTVKKTWEGSARSDSIWVALFVRTSLYAEEVSPWTGVATYYYVENSTQQITDYDSTITWDNLPYVDSNGLRLTYIVTEGTTEELAKKGGGSFEVEIFTTTINGVSREVRADKLVNGSDVYVLQTLAEQQKNASGITTGYDFPIYKNILVKIDAPNIATVFEQETSLKINLPAEGSNTLKKVDIWLENPGTNAPAGPADLTINKINGGWQMSTAGYTLTGPDADGSYTISGFAPFVKDQEIFAKTFGEDSLSNAIESALEHKTVLALVYTEKPANETAYAKIEFLSGANGSFAQGDITTYWVKKGTSWGTFISAVVTLPGINANSGYTFNGWDASGIPQTGEIINDGRTFTASYTKKEMILETNPNDSDYVYISYHSADATDHNNVYGKIKKGVDGALVDTITYYVLKGTTRQDILNAMNESPPKYYIPTIVPNTGYSTVGSESGASGWNILLSDATIINENLDLYVLYFKLDDVIADNTPNEESEKPAGYITITFLAGDNGSLTGVTKYYVNPDAGKTYGDIAEPSIVPNSGYAIAPNPWNPICLKETAITTDATYIAQYLEKTLPPVITRPVANDTTVSGTAPAGSEVIVDFGNGKTVTIEATDGKWTVDVPDGVVLIEEYPISATAKETNKATSDKANTVVQGISAQPIISQPTNGDEIVKGTGEEGATIKVYINSATDPIETIVTNGIWQISLPQGTTLVTDDVITVKQTEAGKADSANVTVKVLAEIIDVTSDPSVPTPEGYVRVTLNASEGTKLMTGESAKAYDIKKGASLNADHYPKVEVTEGYKEPVSWSVPAGTAITANTSIVSTAVKKTDAEIYTLTSEILEKAKGEAATEAEVVSKVRINPAYPASGQQPTVTVDDPGTLPDGSTEGTYTVSVTVRYPDSSTEKVNVTVKVLAEIIDVTSDPSVPTPEGYVRVTLNASEGTKLMTGESAKAYDIKKGASLNADHYPKVEVTEGYKEPVSWSVPAGTAITANTSIVSTAVKKTDAEIYTLTSEILEKAKGEAATEAEVVSKVRINPAYPASGQQPTVTVDDPGTLPDGSTEGTYTVSVTVRYPDSSTEKVNVTVKVNDSPLIATPSEVTVIEGKPIKETTKVVTTNKTATITSTETNGLKVDANGNLTGTPKIDDWKPTEEVRIIEIAITVTTTLEDLTEEKVEIKVNVKVQRDTDGDGIADVNDPDDDNDGYTDAQEIVAKTDPKDSNSKPQPKPQPPVEPYVTNITNGNQTVENGSLIKEIQISSPVGAIVTIDTSKLPNGLVYDSSTNRISGKVDINDWDSSDEKVFVIPVQVKNPDGTISNLDITLTVEAKELKYNEKYNVVGGEVETDEGKKVTEDEIIAVVKITPEVEEDVIASIKVLDQIPTSGLDQKVTVQITYSDGTTDTVTVTINFNPVENKTVASWSFVSLIMTLVSIVSMVALLIVKSFKEDEDGIKLVRNQIYKITTTVSAIIAIAYFILSNNMKMPMTLVNNTTLLSTLITIVTLISLTFGLRWKEDDSK